MSFVEVEKKQNVAIITLNNPPVNALSARLVKPLVKVFTELKNDAQVKGIVVKSANPKIFISGADIKEFGGGNTIEDFVGFLDELEAFNKPIVCAINGVALGGGCEFIMATHYRVAVNKRHVKFGLPELQLGIIPGAAGTQRLPRLIGVKKATEMMLTSRPIGTKEANKLGLVDEVVESPAALMDAAMAAVEKLAKNNGQLRRASTLSDKLTSNDVKTAQGALSMLDRAGKTKNQIHQKACVDSIVAGLERGYRAGVTVERKNFLKCLKSPQAAGLMHIFFAMRNCAKVPGVTDQGHKVPKMDTIAVLGGGTMGAGITAWLLQNRTKKVFLKEINEKAGEVARQRVAKCFASAVKRGRITKQQLDYMIHTQLEVVTDFAKFKQVDVVIEAIFENIKLKQDTFIALEKVCRPDCILASNTSTINIETIAEKTACKNRIVGLHFFAPANIMPLVEIIPSSVTDTSITNAMVALVKKYRKTPLVVGNCVGFLVNRLFGILMQVAAFLTVRHVDPYQIDRAMESFGLAMGPFKTSDLSGNDIGLHVANIMRSAYGDRYIPKSNATLIEKLVAAQRLGQKTGVGYYKYQGRRAVSDPELSKFIAEAAKEAGTEKIHLSFSDQDIVDMFTFTIINEGLRCLNENIAMRSSDIDVSTVLGMGFPSYRGGYMKYGKQVGFDRVYERLNEWYKKFDLVFFKPCESSFYPSTNNSNASLKVDGFKMASTFETMNKLIASRPDLVKKIGAAYGFNLTNGSGKTQMWTVDLKKGGVALGNQNADIVLSLSDDLCVDIMSGKESPMSAFMSGSIQMDGDMQLAMKLQSLTSLLNPNSKM